MEELSYLVRGLAIGLAIAAPVGPIGVLCIRRTLAEGWLTGLVSGLGAATADALYGTVAAVGLTAVTGLLLAGQDWLAVGGGLFLLWLGWRTFVTPPAETAATAADGRGLLAAYASTLALTLTNPATILSFIAVFAGLGLAAGAGGAGSALALVVGVFLGSAGWWLALAGGVSVLRQRLTARHLRWVNWVSGAVLMVFGVVAVASVAFR